VWAEELVHSGLLGLGNRRQPRSNDRFLTPAFELLIGAESDAARATAVVAGLMSLLVDGGVEAESPAFWAGPGDPRHDLVRDLPVGAAGSPAVESRIVTLEFGVSDVPPPVAAIPPALGAVRLEQVTALGTIEGPRLLCHGMPFRGNIPSRSRMAPTQGSAGWATVRLQGGGRATGGGAGTLAVLFMLVTETEVTEGRSTLDRAGLAGSGAAR